MGSKCSDERATNSCGRCIPSLLASLAEEGGLAPSTAEDNRENAEEFFEASDLREVMESAGVVGTPEFHFLDEVEAETVEEPVV